MNTLRNELSRGTGFATACLALVACVASFDPGVPAPSPGTPVLDASDPSEAPAVDASDERGSFGVDASDADASDADASDADASDA